MCPWILAQPIRRITEPGYEIMEEACYEGNDSRDSMIDLGYKPYPGYPGRLK